MPPWPVIRRGSTVEKERLRLVHDTQSAHRKHNPQVAASNIEMMLLRNAFNFVQEDIPEDIAERNGNYDNFETEAATLRPPPVNQLAMDERLAKFWKSRPLTAYAIDAWMRKVGIKVSFPRQREGEKDDDNFDHGRNEFDEFILSKKYKAPGNADGGNTNSSPDTSNPEIVISGGRPDELQKVLTSSPSRSRKRRRTIADEAESEVEPIILWESEPQHRSQRGSEDESDSEGESKL
ncbi:uncharacterized protein Z519_11242 [Cladophialophora bantiana CBS 173.52]|uniref:Uncharacterized protein n=1 Tax=Cladophialophora bantiana (strain ATCC 10958 / CBS 173.52 / CDC B-1940 / NIH 8579) TaxID=1442370 RepID=A0A0D2EDE1_CLAB1|nr:uncharacterized protein Z519_11242 [Cladophialophora bantiana CBS 173.52]KIW88131.1 hypothetical protein Z519_11242 [Cladophialophora bantiana CBS 173.52]